MQPHAYPTVYSCENPGLLVGFYSQQSGLLLRGASLSSRFSYIYTWYVICLPTFFVAGLVGRPYFAWRAKPHVPARVWVRNLFATVKCCFGTPAVGLVGCLSLSLFLSLPVDSVFVRAPLLLLLSLLLWAVRRVVSAVPRVRLVQRPQLGQGAAFRLRRQGPGNFSLLLSVCRSLLDLAQKAQQPLFFTASRRETVCNAAFVPFFVYVCMPIPVTLRNDSLFGLRT